MLGRTLCQVKTLVEPAGYCASVENLYIASSAMSLRLSCLPFDARFEKKNCYHCYYYSLFVSRVRGNTLQ